MNTKYRWLYRLFFCVCAMVWTVAIAAFWYFRVHVDDMNVGVRVVKLMYDFDTPDKLLKNQAHIKEMLVLEEWERLQLDNESRAINAYYKFHYSASKVHIQYFCDGYILYTLENEYIDPTQYWVFEYRVDESSGLLYDIREYRFSSVMKGGYVD